MHQPNNYIQSIGMTRTRSTKMQQRKGVNTCIPITWIYIQQVGFISNQRKKKKKKKSAKICSS